MVPIDLTKIGDRLPISDKIKGKKHERCWVHSPTSCNTQGRPAFIHRPNKKEPSWSHPRSFLSRCVTIKRIPCCPCLGSLLWMSNLEDLVGETARCISQENAKTRILHCWGLLGSRPESIFMLWKEFCNARKSLDASTVPLCRDRICDNPNSALGGCAQPNSFVDVFVKARNHSGVACQSQYSCRHYAHASRLQ